jgi:hypothetical protein
MKDWSTTREFLLEIPKPIATKSYSPIAHSVFINELQEELYKKGYEVAEERYLHANKGQILTGNFRITDNTSNELMPCINFTNSYNKMRKASIRATAMVLVCKNGMMGSTSVGSYSRKHSGTALEDIRIKMGEVVNSLEAEFERLILNVEEMKQIELNKKIIAQLVGDMYINENLIKTEQLSILNNEIHSSINFKGNSVWDFYNHVTESLKNNHPMEYDKQHIKLHSYISSKFNLTGNNRLYGNEIEIAELV